MSYQREIPKCEFCKEPATHGVVMKTSQEGDYGVTYTSFMVIPVCDDPNCCEEAEHMKEQVI